MATGPEMMMKSLLSGMGFDPKGIVETVQGLGKMAVDLKAQLDRMEERQIRMDANAAELLSMAKRYPSNAIIDLPNPLSHKEQTNEDHAS